jgi:hypothetical protein
MPRPLGSRPLARARHNRGATPDRLAALPRFWPRAFFPRSLSRPPDAHGRFKLPSGRAAHQSGIANCGPLFLTLPTILFTGQIFSDSSGQGLSIANNPSSAAGSSPSHLGQSGSLRMTGIRLCNSPITLLGPHVRIVQLSIWSPDFESFHFAHRPAITICPSSAIAIA